MPSLTHRFISSKSHNAVAEPGDEQHTWTRKRLQRMDARFTRRLEWAFRWGHERRASAANEVELPTTPVPYFSTPLTPEAWAGLLRSNIPAPLPD
jgi:hypothetical protein